MLSKRGAMLRIVLKASARWSCIQTARDRCMGVLAILAPPIVSCLNDCDTQASCNNRVKRPRCSSVHWKGTSCRTSRNAFFKALLRPRHARRVLYTAWQLPTSNRGMTGATESLYGAYSMRFIPIISMSSIGRSIMVLGGADDIMKFEWAAYLDNGQL